MAENPYGANHMRNVTLVLLMSWKDAAVLSDSSISKKERCSALLCIKYAGCKLQEIPLKHCSVIWESGWVSIKHVSVTGHLGNEVNSCKEWNYSGSMSLNQCVENYAKAFQLLV